MRTRYMLVMLWSATASAQLTDVTQAPNAERAGIQKSLSEQVGGGRGDVMTPGTSAYLVARDPFRAFVRGRQLFQRKFTLAQGFGPRAGDGIGDLGASAAIGAGLVDSCAGCHGRPHGAAGHGGDVFTRPDSRDAPHLFGLGLVEMLADEMTLVLRGQRDDAVKDAIQRGRAVRRELRAKGVSFGSVTALPDGSVDATDVEGVDADLRVRPFFADGRSFAIRSFVVGAFNAEMGLEAFDPDLEAAAAGGVVVTPTGLVLDGTLDRVRGSPAGSVVDDPDLDGVVDEIPLAVVDFVEHYMVNYFAPGHYRESNDQRLGRRLFERAGCAECHVPDLAIQQDRRIMNVTTTFDPRRGGFNRMFADVEPLVDEVDDGSGFPTLKVARGEPFVVRGIFSDLKRHDLGPAFHERRHDGGVTTQHVTEPLWGVATTAPYGHDGRSINLEEVILRHGGEAQASRDAFADLSEPQRARMLTFLGSLVLFPPPDTASNLDPGDATDPDYPVRRHGSVNVLQLAEDPSDPE